MISLHSFSEIKSIDLHLSHSISLSNNSLPHFEQYFIINLLNLYNSNIYRLLYHSTIFRTIDENATGNANKYGIRNSSYADIANAYNVGGIKGVGNSLSSFITSKDLDNIKEFNRLVLEEGVSSQTAWYKTMQTSSSAAKELFDNEENLIKSGNSVILSEEAISNATNTMTFSAKAGQVALKGLALAGNMIATWVASEVLSGLYKMSQTSEEVANKAQTLGTSFSSTKSELKDYKEQIENLYTTINDSGSSIDEVKNARIQLMNIQDQMIEKYGSEKETVEAITRAIQNETSAWEKLSSAQWKKTKADFNDNGFWSNTSNFFAGYKTNIDRMMDEYGNYSVDIDLTKFNVLKDKDKYDEFKKVLQDVFNTDISVLTNGTPVATLSGDATEVYDKLLQLQDLAKNFDYSEDVSNYLEKLGKEASGVSDKYQEMYNQYVLQEKVFSNSEYSNVFNEIQKKYNAIKEAKTNGDENAISKANEDYASYMSETVANLVGEDSKAVINTFESMYPELQSIVDNWNFKVKIIPTLDINTDDLNGLSSSDILSALTTEGTQNGEDAFNAILKSAEEYGIVSANDADKVQKSLDLLVKWGILQKDVTEETKRTADATNSSFTKDPTSLLTESGDKSKTANLADLKSEADTLKSLQKELEDTGVIGVDSMQKIIKQYPEAKEALYDYMTGVKNEAELFADLENTYNDDKNQYINSMVEQNQANEDFFTSLKAKYPEISCNHLWE